MGMFDYIVCEYPIREEHQSIDDWQTKDTPAQCLDVYIIAKDGRLLFEDYDVEDRSKHTLENHGDECDNIACQFGGAAARVNLRRVDVSPPFTGVVNFYSALRRMGVWVEYSATFENNALLGIVCVSSEDSFKDWVEGVRHEKGK